MRLEICVEGVAAALEAERGGADRVELCANLAVGGVTPGVGAIGLACTRLRIPAHVLIRPRGGDFVFTDLEREEMLRDVEACRSLGVAGVVIGGLDARGDVDEPLVRALIAAARPMSVTFHRAFDAVRDPRGALGVLAELGIDRVLTSGRGRAAREDLELIGELVAWAGERPVILAGGSVTGDDLPRLAAVGVVEAHVGSAACRGGRTEADTVRRLVDIAHAL